MCTPILDFWYLFHIQTNKFPVMKISQYFAFAVCDNVAPWNRHQERRRMPGLQGPQPSFLSKIPILWMLQRPSINIKKTIVSFIATFGERKSLGEFPWTMKHCGSPCAPLFAGNGRLTSEKNKKILHFERIVILSYLLFGGGCGRVGGTSTWSELVRRDYDKVILTRNKTSADSSNTASSPSIAVLEKGICL